jgi:hypothetical protein
VDDDRKAPCGASVVPGCGHLTGVQSLAVGEAEPTPESLWDDHGEHDDMNDDE